MKKVSVIVPIYKVEKYLRRCVDSIINQEYKDLEIILVDDGSPDNCPKICDEYAQKDARIKVVHKENGGLSSARNAGLMVASGDWITFIDSDDYITEDYSNMLMQVQKLDFDVICLPYYEIKNKNVTLKTPKRINKITIDNINFGKVFSGCYNSAWSKLFNHKFLTDNNLYYDEDFRFAEDLRHSMEMYTCAKQIKFCNIPYYMYYRNSSSLTADISYEKILKIVEGCDYGIHKFNLIEDKKIKKFYKKLISDNLMTILYRAQDYNVEQNKELINFLRKNKKYLSYGSTFFKKILVASIKICGIKFTTKIIKKIKGV